MRRRPRHGLPRGRPPSLRVRVGRVGRVKFSKRRSTLTVRFARAKAPAPAPSDPRLDPHSEPEPPRLAEDARDDRDVANDDDNPLAEYLSMLGADAQKSGRRRVPTQASTRPRSENPAKNPTRPAPAVVPAAIAAHFGAPRRRARASRLDLVVLALRVVVRRV